jgi:mRNA deadenylase 3'-5' endonuclease subunit Ccr4
MKVQAMEIPPMSFKIATYNILATSYLRPEWYRGVKPELLQPSWRVPTLVQHVEMLDADIVCLQEVEPDVFGVFDQRLGSLGYGSCYEQKGQAKPEGCATFFRKNLFTPHQARRLDYHDRERGPDTHSGFVALMLALEHAGSLLGVANTHIRWDKPALPTENQIGYRQVRELLDECQRFLPRCRDWVLCGDFNRTPDSALVKGLLKEAGFTFAHHDRLHLRSAVANGRAQLIDYLFHTRGLQSQPFDPPLLTDATKLPAVDQPSDHVPLLAEFTWTF